MIQHCSSVRIRGAWRFDFVVCVDIEEDLNELGDLSLSKGPSETDALKKANERIRQLEEMVGTLK